LKQNFGLPWARQWVSRSTTMTGLKVHSASAFCVDTTASSARTPPTGSSSPQPPTCSCTRRHLLTQCCTMWNCCTVSTPHAACPQWSVCDTSTVLQQRRVCICPRNSSDGAAVQDRPRGKSSSAESGIYYAGTLMRRSVVPWLPAGAD
jgi:hypothetical protein